MHNKTLRRFTVLPAVACIAAAFYSNHVSALSIGSINANPVINAPLAATVNVALASGERLESDCVKAVIYNGDQLLSAALYQTSVSMVGGNAQIRISGQARITEPVVLIDIEVTCQGRLSRRFTLLANPGPVTASTVPGPIGNSQFPSSDGAVGGVPLPAVAPTPQGQTRAAGVGQRINRERGAAPSSTDGLAAKPAATAQSKAKPAASTLTIATTLASPTVAAAMAAPTATAELPSKPSLTLSVAGGLSAFKLSRDLSFKTEQTSPDRREQLKQARDALIAELNGGSGSGAGMASSAALARNAELEQANQKLQAQVLSLQAAVAQEKQAQAKAEADRSSNWLWIALAGLLALIGMIIIFFKIRRPQESVSESVFADQSLSAVGSEPSRDAYGGKQFVPANPIDDIKPSDHTRTWWGRMFPAPATKKRAAAPDLRGAAAEVDPQSLGESVQQAKDSIKINFDDGTDDWGSQSLLTPVEQLAVNEVADLSQEADFFIEIGDFEQAIRLLEQNIDKEHEITPVPQLYLFDLYRRTGRKDEYTSLLTSFAQRFNVYIPSWDDEVTGRRDLLEYSRAMEQICRAWRGNDALVMLEGLLVDDTRGQRMGFDLPAYRDIVFLYGIAKQNMVDAGMGDEIPAMRGDFVDSDNVDFELPTDPNATIVTSTNPQSELEVLRSKAIKAPGGKDWPATVQINAAERAAAEADFEFIDLGAFDAPASDIPLVATPTPLVAAPPLTPTIGIQVGKPTTKTGSTDSPTVALKPRFDTGDKNTLEFVVDEKFTKDKP